MNVQLVMFREDGTQRKFLLTHRSTTVGRANDCTIRIPLGAVSRRHAEIIVGDGKVILKDLGASNGTFLNNRRITRQDTLAPGDQITVGPVIFTVQINGEPTDEEIAKTRTSASSGSTAAWRGSRVGTSKHVYTVDDEIDPIAALEALASSADQTAIHPEQEDEG
ncbi:MAG: FHA domain-containing protein [Phycisphaerae bacterium]